MAAMMPLMLALLAPFSSCSLTPADSLQLPPCQPVRHLVSLEKEGCPYCHTVETTVCSGYCPTQDTLRSPPPPRMYQHVCTYGEVYYETVVLPGCLPGVDPVVSYPVARSCECGICSERTTTCITQGLGPDICVNDIMFY